MVISLITVLVIALLWWSLYAHLREERAHEFRETGAHAQTLARVVAEHMQGTIERADDALRELGAEFLREGPRTDVSAVQHRQILRTAVFNRISIIGADGYVVVGSGSGGRVYVGDLENFSATRDMSGDGLHIGKPIVGRSTGKWAIHLTRRIVGRDGAFAGMSTVALEPQYFSAFYESIDIGRDGIVVLVGEDGVVRATEIGSVNSPQLAQQVSDQPFFRQMANRPAGHIVETEPDGKTRIIGFHRLAHYPLVAAVIISEDTALEGYDTRVPRYLFAATITTVLMLLLATMLITAFSRQIRIANFLRMRDAESERARETMRALSAHNTTIREEERTRIARKLHDELGQLLTGLKLSLSAMPLSKPQCVDAASSEHGRIMELVEKAIIATRHAVSDLRPPALDQGLVAAIGWLAVKFERHAGVTCRLDLPEDEPVLDDARATALFRIVQESLTNVARHADAKTVCISLSASADRLHLIVRDDGCGFAPGEVSSERSFGLQGMRERAAMLGGAIEITSAPDGGTTVSAYVTRKGIGS